MTSKRMAMLGIGGLAAQLVFWHAVNNPPLRGPVRGEPFPTLEAQGLGQKAPRVLGEGVDTCLVVTVMATGCPFCSRMRHTWNAQYRAWRAGTTANVSVVWLFSEPEERVESWTEGRSYDDVTVMTLSGRERATVRRRLGVVGTPMSYLVGKDGKVLVGIAGPRLPPSDLVSERCG